MIRRGWRFLAVTMVAITVLSVLGGTGAGVAADPAAAGPPLATGSVLAPTNVSSCTTITSPGVYTLNTSLNPGGGVERCIEINASDVVFEGNEFTIDGQNNQTPSYGIYVAGAYSNVTVRNVTLNNWGWALRYRAGGDGYNSTVANLTVTKNLNGIDLVDTAAVEVRNNTIFGNGDGGDYGLRIRNTNDTNVTDNVVRNNRGEGITVDRGSDGNEFTDTLVDNNSDHGINVTARSVSAPTGNQFDNTTVTNNGDAAGEHGILLDAAPNNRFVDLTVNGSSGWEVLARPGAGRSSRNNSFGDVDLGFENATFAFRLRDAKLRSVPPGSQPAITFGDGIGVFLNLTNTSGDGYVNTTVEYNDSALDPAVTEGSMALWRYESSWTRVGGTVDTATDTLVTNVTSFSTFAPAATRTITDCTTISAPGEYRVTADLTNASIRTCILINTSDVVLDGQNHTIDGVDNDTDSVGIMANNTSTVTNVTVRNVTVTEWDTGVEFGDQSGATGTNHSLIANVTAFGNANIGIKLHPSTTNDTIRDSRVDGTEFGGVGANASGANHTIRNVTVEGGIMGILLGPNTTNVTLRNNTVLNTTGDVGLGLDGTGHTVVNNTVENNTGGSGISVGSGSKFRNNTLRNNTLQGIFARGSNNTFRNTTIRNSRRGVLLVGSDNRFWNTSIRNSGNWSILVVSRNDSGTVVPSVNNTFGDLDLGIANVTPTLTPRHVGVRPVSAGDRPTIPGIQDDIGVYLNATNASSIFSFSGVANDTGARINLSLEYTDAVITDDLDESTLSVWRYDDSWEDLGRDTFDETANRISKNVSNFSVLAPLAVNRTIDSCGTIDTEGVYTVGQDITNPSTEVCLLITVSNVTVRGGNHTIDGVNRTFDSAGILANNTSALTNVTVRNVTVTGWDTGVKYGDFSAPAVVNDSVVENVTARLNQVGIGLGGATSNVTVGNSTVRDSTDEGYVLRGDNHTLRSSRARNSSTRGISVFGNDTAVLNSTSRRSGFSGMLYFGDRARLRNVTAANNNGSGVIVVGNDSVVRNVTATGNDGYGFGVGGNRTYANNTTLRSNGNGTIVLGGNNAFHNTTIRNSSNWSVIVASWNRSGEVIPSINNTFRNLDLGIANVTPTLTTRHVAVRPVAAGDRPALPGIQDDIGAYFNVTNASDALSDADVEFANDTGARINLSLEYTDAVITGGIDESTLSVWRYDDSWEDLGRDSFDETANRISKNVSNFSVLAPLAVNRTIDSCGTIDTEGVYTVGKDITNPSTEVCLLITASNVTVRGGNHTIDGVNRTFDSAGILANNTSALTNVTVRNVTVTGWETGVEYSADFSGAVVNDSLVENVTAVLNENGVGLGRATSNVTVANVTVRDSTDTAYFLFGDNHTVRSSVARNSSASGIVVFGNDSVVRNVTASGSGGIGLGVVGNRTDANDTRLLSNGNGTLVYGANNAFRNTTVRNSSNWSVIVASWNRSGTIIPSVNNTFQDLDLGIDNVTPTLTPRHVAVRPVAAGDRPAPPGLQDDVGAYFNVTNASDVLDSSFFATNDTGARINLSLEYDQSLFADSRDESTLSVWRYDGNWSDLGRDSFDETANRISKNVSNFSVLAPLAVNRTIDSCATIDREGRFTLASDLVVNDTDVCLLITASNVTVDGGNHTIDGVDRATGSTAIRANNTSALTNVTVRNVTVTGWEKGVEYGTVDGVANDFVNDSVVENVTARLNQVGIGLGRATSNVTVGNSTVRDSTDEGYVLRGDNHTLRSSRARNSSTRGITVVGNDTAVLNSTSRLSGFAGMLYFGDRARLRNVTAVNNNGSGVVVSGNASKLQGINATDNGRFGLAVAGNRTSASDSTLRRNANGTIVLGANNRFRRTTVRNSTDWAVIVASDERGGRVIPSVNNTFSDLDLGIANVTPTLTPRHVALRPVAPGDRPLKPAIQEDIGAYFNVTNASDVLDFGVANDTGARINLSLVYDDAAIPPDADESTLSVWRYDRNWTDLGRDSFNMGINRINKSVSNFSVLAPLAVDRTIDSCGVINREGEYALASNITANNTHVCLLITVSNVTVDGAGYTIDGVDNANGSVAVRANATETLTNVTVRDVTVTGWGAGVEYGGSGSSTAVNDSRIANIVASDNDNGVLLWPATTNVTVRDSRILGGSGVGLAAGGPDHAVVNLTVRGGSTGVLFPRGVNASGIAVRNSTVRNTTRAAFEVHGTDHVLANNTALDNAGAGLAGNFSGSVVENTTARRNAEGLNLTGADNRLSNSTLRNNTRGIVASGSNNTFRSPTLRDSTAWSVVVVTRDGDPPTVATFERADVGFANATLSFSARHVSLRPVPAGARPAPPTVHEDIGTYLNASNTSAALSAPWVADDSAHLNLTVEYDGAAITGGLDESSLSVWRYDGAWTDLGRDALDTTANTVRKNLTNFSVFAPLGIDRSISQCTTIDRSGEYTLATDLTAPSADPCIRIEASNVTLDGRGHTIDGVNWTAGSRGVLVDPASPPGTNVTVRNLTVARWDVGVQVGTTAGGLNGSTVADVTATDSADRGVVVLSSSGVAVRRTTVTNASVAGIDVSGTDHTLADNTVENGAGHGVVLSGTGHALSNNTARDNLGAGFFVSGTGHEFAGDAAANNSDGVELSSVSDAVFRNTTLSNNREWSVASAGGATNVTFLTPELGIANATLSFTLADANLTPAAAGNRPAPPGVQRDLGVYVNASAAAPGAYLNLTVAYDGAALEPDEDESSLSLWRNDGAWTDLGRDALDTSTNTLRKNVTNFSVLAPLAVDRTIDGCTVINEGGQYSVVADVTNASADPCILVAASNVTLDGQGHTIDGGGGGAGREAVQVQAADTLSNVTVGNLTVTNWGTGVRVGGANTTALDGGRVRAVTAVGADVAGIATANASNVTVVDSTVRDSAVGIRVDGTNNTVRSNALRNDSVGIAVRPGSSAIRVHDNAVRNGTGNASGTAVGIRVDGGSARVTNNTAGAAATGVLVAGNGDGGVYRNNSLANATVGVRLDGAANNRFVNTSLPTNASWSVSAVPNATFGASANNTFVAPELGFANATLTFTVRDARLRPVPEGARPAPPGTQRDLGVYLNATDTSSNARLEVTTVYTDAVAATFDERSVAMWRNDGNWTELGGTADPGSNTHTATITGFSVFAPLADPPTPEYGVTITDTNSPVNAGRPLNVTTRVENTGNESGPLNVSLSVGGTVRDVVAPNLSVGETRTITLSWKTGRGDGGNYTATVASPNATDSTNVTVRTESFFAVSNVSTNGPVVAGDTLRVAATVENVGDQTGTHSVALRVDGDKKDSTTLTLDPGESTSVVLSWSTGRADAGNHTVRVLSPHSSESTTALVQAPGNATVTVDSTNAPVTEGETLTVNTTVENTGDETTTQEIRLLVDGTEYDATTVTLAPGESRSVDLSWTTEVGDAGDHAVTVDSGTDTDSTSVTVDAKAPFFAVSIDDTTSPVAEGNNLTVTARIENTGGETATQEVTLSTDGIQRDAATVRLAPGESTTVELVWETAAGDAGNYTARVIGSSTSATADVSVVRSTAEASISLGLDATNAPVTEGDTLEVTATLDNTGGRTGTRTVTLSINGSQRDSTEVTVGAGESRTVTLVWETGEGDAGNYTALVSIPNGSVTANVTVEAPSAGGGGQGNVPPTASLPPIAATVGEPVTVEPTVGDDGEVVDYEWTVDGRVVSGSETLQYTFQSSGEHTVLLRVTDDEGASTTARRVVTANAPPEASFQIGSVSLGESVSVEADVSDSDGNVTDYVWTVDGQIVSRSATMSYTFESPGVQEVTLRVTDDRGASTTATESVRVNSPPSVSIPEFSATAGERTTVEPQVNDDGEVGQFEWTVDGETVAETRTLNYTFSEPGTHELQLRVVDDDGASAIASRTVEVAVPENRRPEAVVSVDAPATVTVCDTITVDASASSDPDGNVASYRLDVDGDGSYETENAGGTFTHRYESGGEYTLVVEVTDDGGATETAERTVTVEDADCEQVTTTTVTTTVNATSTTTVPNQSTPADDPIIAEDTETWLFGMVAAGLILLVGYYVFRRRTI